jgi:hypothetical protein
MASNLEAIRAKVRRLTSSPSVAQLSVDDLDEYINTFVLYDLPANLGLFTLRENLVFYAAPNVGEYATNTINADDPLYNFINRYITFHKPVYCDGYELVFSQSQEEFRTLYPETLRDVTVATGDGIVLAYGGTLTGIPVVPGSVLVESVDAGDAPLSLYDQQVLDPVTGIPTEIGNIIETNSATVAGAINYITGAYNFNFPVAPGANEDINIHYSAHVPSRPNTLFYFNNKFYLRPIPDKVYKITIEAYKRPTILLAGESPELEQWSQYIAFGAARKVFEDRTDMESVAMLMPLFKEQERLILRRTIVQQSNERVATLYTENLIGDYHGL